MLNKEEHEDRSKFCYLELDKEFMPWIYWHPEKDLKAGLEDRDNLCVSFLTAGLAEVATKAVCLVSESDGPIMVGCGGVYYTVKVAGEKANYTTVMSKILETILQFYLRDRARKFSLNLELDYKRRIIKISLTVSEILSESFGPLEISIWLMRLAPQFACHVLIKKEGGDDDVL